MRLAAAAARGGASQLLQPGAAHLSTSTPAASIWRQALAAAAAALGGTTPASSSAAIAAASAVAAAPPTRPEQEHSRHEQGPTQRQQQQKAHTQEEQQWGMLDAWRRGAEGVSERQSAAASPAAVGPSASPNDQSSSRRSSRRARRLDKQRPPEAYAAATGKQPAANVAGSGSGSGSGNGSGGSKSNKTANKAKPGKKNGSKVARPDSSSAMRQPECPSSTEVIDLDGHEASKRTSSSSSACPLPPARILQDDAHPIRETDISRAAWLVLSRLRAAGHEVYVVGGTVRDLLLGGTPKDFDILTSAEPHQVKRLFSRCIIVGRAFPVCQVFTEGTMIEVSSFSTQADTQLIPVDASIHMIGRQKSKDAKWRREGATWAQARAANASRRDFTVNGLLYEPFSRLLFDSVGGLEDCTARRLRTICPPAESFATDPARILRGVRLAARANLELDPDTAAAMEDHAAAIGQLPQGRLQMELTSLLGYGASERSLLLMWRLGLLDMLLPQHALYLRRHKVPRAPRSRSGSRRPELLFQLAAELDKHVHPQRPVDPCVWVALLAAPLVADRIAELWKQARQESTHAAKASQQAHQAAIGSSISVVDLEHTGSTGEGSMGSSDMQSGSSSGSASSGSSGSDSEGDNDLLVDGQTGAQAASRDAAWRRDFVEPYHQIVCEVLDSMLLPLDAAIMQQLGRQAKKHSHQLRQAVGGPRRKRGGGATTDGASSTPPERPLLPSVLTRPSIERAASLLHMEAELRGRSELQTLLEHSRGPGKVAPAFHNSGEGGGNGGGGSAPHDAQPVQQREQQKQPEGQQAQQHLGRQSLHHTLWQRLERAAGGSGDGSGGGSVGAHLEEVPSAGSPGGSKHKGSAFVDVQAGAGSGSEAEAEAVMVPESLPRKLRKRRALSPEERLVLGILSDPRFDYQGRTQLPPAVPAT